MYTRNKGMSLVEVAIAMTIFAILMTAAFQVLNASTNFFKHEVVKDNLRVQAEVAVNRMISMLQDVTEESIRYGRKLNTSTGQLDTTQETKPFTNVSFIRYKTITGIVENSGEFNRTYSTKEYAIFFQLSNHDTNQNGKKDEGRIVLMEYDDETVADDAGKVLTVFTSNVMIEYDNNPGAVVNNVPGLSMTCEPDSTSNTARWLIKVSIALEKIDPSAAKKDTTKIYYKTTTISLAK